MTTTVFRQGNPIMVDHTPSVAVTAGDVVVVGDLVRIAHSDIEANKLGALAAGHGVYDVPKATGAGTAIADGKVVYWDATNSVATVTSTGNKKLGVTVAASTDSDTTVRVLHIPE